MTVLCFVCGKPGAYKDDNDIPIVILSLVNHGESRYAHPECYVKERGVNEFLSLPNSELEMVRIRDISGHALNKILEKLLIK